MMAGKIEAQMMVFWMFWVKTTTPVVSLKYIVVYKDTS